MAKIIKKSSKAAGKATKAKSAKVEVKRGRGRPPKAAAKEMKSPVKKGKVLSTKAMKGKVKPAKATKASKKVEVKAVKKGAYAKELGLEAIDTAMGKTDLLNSIAEESEVDLKSVKAVWASLEAHLLASLMPGGAGEFTIPGIVKFVTKEKPARKKGVMVRNPATGTMVPGAFKPASTKVTARVLTKPKKVAV